MEYEDCLMIVKYLAIGTPDEDDIEGRTTPIYKLARITLPYFERTAELTDREIRKEWEDFRRNEVNKELMDRLFAAAVIEYPHGAELFKPPEKPAKPSKPGGIGISKEPQKEEQVK